MEVPDEFNNIIMQYLLKLKEPVKVV